MAYDQKLSNTVTASRRRPQKFADLVGQEFVAATLENSLKRQQIANAYLFSGPRGCGKTSSARIMAKALNCKKGDCPQVVPCGECESCKAIAASSSMDVLEIDGASNTSVNDVRAIKDEVLFPPNSSRYKIYIIDEVHMLSTSAFNALLKTIEEPPPYVVFIFATTELQKVPATIKSRCQQFSFRLVAIDKIEGLLEDACKEIEIKFEKEGLYWVARESGGSVRDAYTLFDQVASFSDGNITYDKIKDKLGLIGCEALNELFGKCCDGDTKSVLDLLDQMLSGGISIDTIISNCTDYIRSILLIKNGVTKESLLSAALTRYDTKVLQSWSGTQVERALSIFLQLYRDTRYTLNSRYETELAFTLLSSLKEYVSPSEVKAALNDTASILLGEGLEDAPSNNNIDKSMPSLTTTTDNNDNNSANEDKPTSISVKERLDSNVYHKTPSQPSEDELKKNNALTPMTSDNKNDNFIIDNKPFSDKITSIETGNDYNSDDDGDDNDNDDSDDTVIQRVARPNLMARTIKSTFGCVTIE